MLRSTKVDMRERELGRPSLPRPSRPLPADVAANVQRLLAGARSWNEITALKWYRHRKWETVRAAFLKQDDETPPGRPVSFIITATVADTQRLPTAKISWPKIAALHLSRKKAIDHALEVHEIHGKKQYGILKKDVFPSTPGRPTFEMPPTDIQDVECLRISRLSWMENGRMKYPFIFYKPAIAAYRRQTASQAEEESL